MRPRLNKPIFFLSFTRVSTRADCTRSSFSRTLRSQIFQGTRRRRYSFTRTFPRGRHVRCRCWERLAIHVAESLSCWNRILRFRFRPQCNGGNVRRDLGRVDRHSRGKSARKLTDSLIADIQVHHILDNIMSDPTLTSPCLCSSETAPE